MRKAIGLLALLLAAGACCAQQPDAMGARTLHPSWDMDGDGVNDCERDGSCDHVVDYSQPRNTQPAFDCANASSQAESLICRTPSLGLMDQHLARAFRLALANAKDPALLKAEQRGWIKGRNDCWKSEDLSACVSESYQQRIRALESGNFAGQSNPPQD